MLLLGIGATPSCEGDNSSKYVNENGVCMEYQDGELIGEVDISLCPKSIDWFSNGQNIYCARFTPEGKVIEYVDEGMCDDYHFDWFNDGVG